MRVIGINSGDVLTSSDVPEWNLGTRVMKDDGREYIYVEADEAIAESAVALIHEDYGAENLDATSSAPGTGQGMPVGLCVAAIASGGYGWLQVSGVGDVSVAVGSSCAVHTLLFCTTTPGRLDDAGTSGLEQIDGLVTTGAESSNLAACFLTNPRVGATA